MKLYLSKNIIDNPTAQRFLLCGDSCVGKTQFLERFSKNQFSENRPLSTGLDKEIKYFKLYNKIYKVTLWDQPGQERFRAVSRKTYYPKVDGFLLLFDLTDKNTFNNISSWIKEIKDNIPKEKETIIYLIGNKIDSSITDVSKNEAEALAKSLGIQYFEVSCKLNINISEVMSRMIIESIFGKINIDDSMRIIFNATIRRIKKIFLDKYINY